MSTKIKALINLHMKAVGVAEFGWANGFRFLTIKNKSKVILFYFLRLSPTKQFPKSAIIEDCQVKSA